MHIRMKMLQTRMSLPPLISQNYGADRIDRVQQAYRTALKSVLIIQAVIYLLMLATAHWIAMAFAEEKATHDT